MSLLETASIIPAQYLIIKGISEWGLYYLFVEVAANLMIEDRNIDEIPENKEEIHYFVDDIRYLDEALKITLGLK
ncbi:hypothetical protein [Scytonema sp. NUACC26]|uniref:hypothetical protein n=1 Tax=Scytonema sp. NUACC26 TaxID=3140176 RepID=UPI0034DC6268